MAAILHPAGAGCADGDGLGGRALTAEQPLAEHRGAASGRLHADLVRIRVETTQALTPGTMSDPAECAVAGHVSSQGCGFARHVREIAGGSHGIRTGDMVSMISSVLPAGVKMSGAEVLAASCRDKGRPLVLRGLKEIHG